MQVRIADDWKALLQEEFDKPYFEQLTNFVRSEYSSRKIFPSGRNIFRAFDQCPLSSLKVVIIGQDPYHGVGQANGLCFSVNDGEYYVTVSHPMRKDHYITCLAAVSDNACQFVKLYPESAAEARFRPERVRRIYVRK